MTKTSKWKSQESFQPLEKVEAVLHELCGVWEDTQGSSYSLALGESGGIDVWTTRPSGKGIMTHGLIRIEKREDKGRVIWGRGGGRSVYELSDLDDSYLVWHRPGSLPFEWTRVEDERAWENEGWEDAGQEQWERSRTKVRHQGQQQQQRDRTCAEEGRAKLGSEANDTRRRLRNAQKPQEPNGLRLQKMEQGKLFNDTEDFDDDVSRNSAQNTRGIGWVPTLPGSSVPISKILVRNPVLTQRSRAFELDQGSHALKQMLGITNAHNAKKGGAQAGDRASGKEILAMVNGSCNKQQTNAGAQLLASLQGAPSSH